MKSMGLCMLLPALVFAASCAIAAPETEMFGPKPVWHRRFVLDAELPIPAGYAFLPVGRCSARVDRLPGEMRLERDGQTLASFAAPTNVTPPYEMSLMLTGAARPAVFVTKGGRTSLSHIVTLPKGVDLRVADYTNAVRFVVSEGLSNPRQTLSAGVGQADVRFVTHGRTNVPFQRDGRLFFTFSARAYGSYLGVMSFNPDRYDFRLEGLILFDMGDGLLRNDIAADLFFDDVADEWRAYVCNFSSADATHGRAPGGVNCAWSKRCPLQGVSVMRSRSLELDGMNEDPDGYWDAAAGKWRLLVSEFTKQGIRASLLEADAWTGPFRRIAGPVGEDSTGTTLVRRGGKLQALTGSADKAFYVYDYPTLARLGKIDLCLPPWTLSSSSNGRSWAAYAELRDGRKLLLTFDRVNFPGMPSPNWTYGELYLYASEEASRAPIRFMTFK